MRLTALAQLIAIHMANGITTTKELARRTEYSERAILKAKAELDAAKSAPECGTGVRQHPGAELECGTPVRIAPECGTPVRDQKEIPPTPPKEKTTLPRTTLSNSSEVAAAASARKVADAQLSPLDLEEQLIEACNGALDNPANCSGLLNLSIPMMWIREGADLETVILPTLRAAGKRYHGKRVRDWSYFTGMVTEAKARVARGLPGEAEPDQKPVYGGRALAAGARRRAAREAAAAMEAAHG